MLLDSNLKWKPISMRIKQGDSEVTINTLSNWPLMVDLFVKWGYPEVLLETAKENNDIKIKVSDLNKVIGELSAWGIPWKRSY